MSLSDRIRLIIRERGLNQRKFAESVYVTEGYISRLLNDAGVGISKSTAMLIEKVHGYAKDWILKGTEPKLSAASPRPLTPTQKKIIAEIERMSDDELFFILTYIEALKKKKAMETKTDKGEEIKPQRKKK
ncbi:MAG: helix-turn-helix domain-containing protein [Spirochaetales bacterium]|jgi:transcriptional regulator with XRE-family HTH domain|nr:helix-turn-helix domain-containing protein [Spirochaetales bacterium]